MGTSKIVDVFDEYAYGCSDYSVAVMKLIMLIFCTLTILVDINIIVSYEYDVGKVMIDLVQILVVSFGAVGAYKKNYKLLLIFAVASLVFGSVMLSVLENSKSLGAIMQEMVQAQHYARQYDFKLLPNSTTQTEANKIWDQWQSKGCCGILHPADWKAWANHSAPRSCCRSEQNVDSNNECTKPYEAGCMGLYLMLAVFIPSWKISASILSLLCGVMAPFMALKYYLKGLPNGTHAVRESHLN